MLIVGAGLSGLIAANLLPDARIIEAATGAVASHKAVLRFRGPEVGNALGIDFRPVTVHKGIWMHDKLVVPDIRLANLYSSKVINRISDRSIWKVEPSTRFIAPENFYFRLVERCYSRIQWNTTLNLVSLDKVVPTISTAPMVAVVRQLSEVQKIVRQASAAKSLLTQEAPQFSFAPIKVERHRIKGCDAFQTIYFPDPEFNVYRASITGDLLIVESMMNEERSNDTSFVLQAFGINAVQQIEPSSKQSFGKIAPINDTWRRAFIRAMSDQFKVYSLGRFATWRNILLDDVLKDIYVIKKLIEGDSYAAAKHAVL